ncbi:STM4015 family protein [Kitasatospora viridis]|uniref:Leucine rich repeat (LRR) protein n=1 Tax=Kitasatospora viridis TaxID=281105 RepID=A0A561UQA4_9ACTN|nr:STM4015 family protein [Kitasatospora viridis]TWG01509.1 hypothetical protein FHX73_115410 [Kitasatospora viridis]
MAISEHLKEFHGLPVHDLFPDTGGPKGRQPAPEAAAWRVAVRCYEDGPGFADRWQQFLDTVDTERITAVVIGPWFEDGEEPLTDSLALITASADRFPNLRALFIGDVVYEEHELSWLHMADITPALTAFPQLEELVVRGGQDLVLTEVRHERLRALRLETGGLPGGVVRALGACELPALERLELWLGVSWYGGDATVPDLAPFLDGSRFPALRHLGLEDSELADEIASAVAGAPVVARLESLSLAMGTLTDEGATALLSGQPLTHLRALDLHHHFLSDEMIERIRLALPEAEVDLSEQEREEGEWRYVANGE